MSCVREGDTVARLGGDEFMVMLENLSEQPIEAAAQTEAIGEKILAALNQPYHLASHEYHSTASIGAILFKDHEASIEELMKQADIAMYQAKKAGRNTLRFFDPQMQDAITARVSLEDELRKALEKQQFQLYYQIQVDSSHRPLGAEALIRWIHPERGLVLPAGIHSAGGRNRADLAHRSMGAGDGLRSDKGMAASGAHPRSRSGRERECQAIPPS